jgi:hypothetical protein
MAKELLLCKKRAEKDLPGTGYTGPRSISHRSERQRMRITGARVEEGPGGCAQLSRAGAGERWERGRAVNARGPRYNQMVY